MATPNKPTHNPLPEKQDYLIVAFEQNWEHARHQETQRQTMLSIYLAIFGAVLTFIADKFNGLETLAQYWTVFLFLGLISIFVSYSIAKWNEEFKNHIRAIQWLSEKMKLIQRISENDTSCKLKATCVPNKEKFRKSKMREALINDAFFEGYVGLPLPLPRRAHQGFNRIIDIFLIASISAGVFGFFLSIPQFVLNQSINNMDLVTIVALLSVSIGIGFVVALYSWKIRIQMEINSQKILAVRSPCDEIKCRYKNIPYFYEAKQNNIDNANEKTNDTGLLYYTENETHFSKFVDDLKDRIAGKG
jgi:hypothetical protein